MRGHTNSVEVKLDWLRSHDALAELVVTCAREADGMEAGGSNRQPKTPNYGGPSGGPGCSLYSGQKEWSRGHGRRGRGFRH